MDKIDPARQSSLPTAPTCQSAARRPSATSRGSPKCRSARRRRRSTPAAGCGRRRATRYCASPARSAIGPTTSRRACIARKSRTIGIISNDSFGRFTFPIVEALEERLADEGIAVFMCNATDDPARERQHLDQLLGKRIDGLVVTRAARRQAPADRTVRPWPAGRLRVHPGRRSRRALPVAGRRRRRRAGGRASGGRGRTRIAHVTGPEHFEAVRLRRERLFRRARRGRACRASTASTCPEVWSEAWGRDAVARLFDGRRVAARRAVLRQRPDRPRRGRRAARTRHRRACATWRSSASTIGT